MRLELHTILPLFHIKFIRSKFYSAPCKHFYKRIVTLLSFGYIRMISSYFIYSSL